MKGIFIPEITVEMFRNGCLESIETLMAEGEVYDIEYDPKSAQPERKKGKWIDYSDEGYVECPFCHSATNCDGNKDELHYCFSCGAELRGDSDDNH